MERYVRGGGTEINLQKTSGEEDRVSGAESLRFCRKCFLREMELRGGLKASYEAMLERIEMMEPELRCTGEVYDARLAQCKKCEYLAEGMCGLCGCFAESRAAVKANSCPAEEKRWLAM